MKTLVILLAAALAFSFTQKNKKFKGPEGFVFVPSGKTSPEGEEYSCAAFWMSDHEVTNGEYRFFLKDLKAEDRMDEYHKAYPDTIQWVKQLKGSNDQMANMYFWHPAYADFPVVNVSKEGAELYCQYLTEKYKMMYGDQITPFRLPTRGEWMYAALADHQRSIYPWGGNDTRNFKGEYMANYVQIGDANITRSEDGIKVVDDPDMSYSYIKDGAMYTAPKDAYEPNDFGLYNMSGNVSEWVSDDNIVVGGDWNSMGYDIRVQSKRNADGPSPFTGFRPVMSFLAE